MAFVCDADQHLNNDLELEDTTPSVEVVGGSQLGVQVPHKQVLDAAGSVNSTYQKPSTVKQNVSVSSDNDNQLQQLYSPEAAIKAHIGMVKKIAKGYCSYGLDFDELIAEGIVGLLQALAKFDPTKNTKFSTYATWWIKAQVIEYAMRNRFIVRVFTTNGRKKLFFKINWLKKNLGLDKDTLNLSDQDAETIAEATGSTVRDVHEINSALNSGVSFSTNSSPNDTSDASFTLEDQLVDVGLSAESQVFGEELQKVVAQAFALLSAREKEIVRKRRFSNNPPTLEQLAISLSLSRERVRQIEHSAVLKLQRFVESKLQLPQHYYKSASSLIILVFVAGMQAYLMSAGLLVLL